MNPRFYRLRKRTVEEVLVPRRGDGEMRKGLLKSSPPDEQCNEARNAERHYPSDRTVFPPGNESTYFWQRA